MEHNQTGYLNNDFQTCLEQLMNHGMDTFPRPDSALGKTKELLNYNITLKSARNRIITFPERNTNLGYLLGEFIWYLVGDNTTEGILPYSKFWGNITNTGDYDGYKKGSINSNYGNRLFGHATLDAFQQGPEQINQWQETIDLLTRDKATRQAIMNIHVPSDRHVGNKDVPCTLTLQWFIRENRLHLIVNMRSNDVILGFTNDVFQFTMLQECMLVELHAVYPELELGHYFHNAGSMHIYDKHFEMAGKIIASDKVFDLEMIRMDAFNTAIVQNLKLLEINWVTDGKPVDYDFTALEAYKSLTPYWQTLVRAMFNKDEGALHLIFGQDHDSSQNVPA